MNFGVSRAAIIRSLYIVKNDSHLGTNKIRLKEIILLNAFSNGKARASSLRHPVQYCSDSQISSK